MACVVTLTLNPTVDESTHVDALIPNTKLRCTPAVRQPGGGGINVARVAARLGQPVFALWTRGGPHGDELHRLLDEEGVAHEPIPIRERTRRNLSIQVGEADELYRLVYQGPTVHPDERERILERVANLRDVAFFVASGSLPPGLEPGFYGEVLRRLPSGVPTVVDTRGPALAAAARVGTTLLKPNRRELGELVGRALDSEADVRTAAAEVLDGGRAEILVVSLGPDGALVATREGIDRIQAPKVVPRSEVGAGDSAVAGIVVGLARGMQLVEAARLGMACGAAAVSTPGTDLAPAAIVERLFGPLPPP